jgi:hypothetical protein
VEKIERNDKEHVAFNALRAALRSAIIEEVLDDIDELVTAEAIEQHLLARGFVIIRISPTNI